MIKKAGIFTICLILNIFLASRVSADEINVSVAGNGTESSNEVVVQSQNTNSVTQENNASINNTVTTDSNTGNNSAGSNTGGDSTVSTGDVHNSTTIDNSNINSNTSSQTTCDCETDTLSKTVSNGSGSTNSTYITNTNSTVLGQNNTANITNNIKITANTGYNTSSYNGGDSTIVTGNIYTSSTIQNKNINNNVFDGNFSINNSSVVIKENGADTINTSLVDDNFTVVVTDINIANILNNVEEDLNTGGNSTIKNLGDSVIVTGDIKSIINIINENINSNFVDIDCGCAKPEKPVTPPTTSVPTAPIGGTSIVQGASGSSSPSSGGISGSVLPVTGGTVPYTYIMTLILFFTLLTGLYLRFHSAHAPPVVA